LPDDFADGGGLMRMRVILPAVFVLLAVFAVAACTQDPTQRASADARAEVSQCGAENEATPESHIIAARLWMGDGTDTIVKLTDQRPLTPAERTALTQVHTKAAQCRQIFIAHATQYAPAQLPIIERYVARSDQIFDKLVNAGLPVSIANRLSIENDREFQDDFAGTQGSGIKMEVVQRRREVDAMLAQASQIEAAQTPSQIAAPSCSWNENTLECSNLCSNAPPPRGKRGAPAQAGCR
jgi:hypothetical protein